MIHNKFRYILTLVALFAMTAGAWATDDVLLTTVTATSLTTYSQSPDGIVTVTLNNIGSYYADYGWVSKGSVTVEAPQGYTITRCVFKQYPSNSDRVLVDDQAPFTATIVPDTGGDLPYVYAETSTGDVIGGGHMDGISSIEVYGTAEPPIAVTWNAATKTATFEMPAYDVEIAPIYAPVAKWATEGDAVLTPTAIEGIYAGTTDAIVKAGTVATAGTTENPQGLVMYAVTTTNTTAPALSAFSSELPTAANIADDGATVYVWYYIAGADTPDGQEATAENTFNDSEICAQPLEVIVLSNKFDITFNAANANTIEAGKATVTVGGTAATVTEGKLEGVKMGSEVKMTAKDGYKFRKVEAKKGAAAGPLTIYSWESPSGTPTETGGTIKYVNGDTSNGDRVNYIHTETGKYTICLNGKLINITDDIASENSGRMDVTLDEALAAGDVISFTAYIYKIDTGASSDAYVIFNGANGFDKGNMSVYAESDEFNLANNLYSSGAAKTVTVKVPAEAAGCKSFSMTRGITKTNLFITKLEVLRGAAAE